MKREWKRVSEGGEGKVICESRMLGGERTAMSSSCREKL